MDNHLSIALHGSLGRYMETRKGLIPSEWEKIVSLENCAAIQRRHFLTDLIYNPLNTLWAIPYLSIKKTLEVCDKLGVEVPDVITSKIPKAIKTNFQKEMERRMRVDLFGLPGASGQASALAVEVENNEALKAAMSESERKTLVAQAEADVHKVVAEFCTTHNGFTDLAASTGVLLIARRFFRDSSLDVFGIGRRWAGRWAREDAVSNFVFGRRVGSIFYRFAPVPGPTHKQIFVATAWSLVMLALFSTVVNTLSYSVQNKLGFHRKQLERLIQGVEDRLLLRFTKSARTRPGSTTVEVQNFKSQMNCANITQDEVTP